jgi:hypothetical protein
MLVVALLLEKPAVSEEEGAEVQVGTEESICLVTQNSLSPFYAPELST